MSQMSRRWPLFYLTGSFLPVLEPKQLMEIKCDCAPLSKLVVLCGLFNTVSQWWCWQFCGNDLSPLSCQHFQVPVASSVPVTYNQYHSLAAKPPFAYDQLRHEDKCSVTELSHNDQRAEMKWNRYQKSYSWLFLFCFFPALYLVDFSVIMHSAPCFLVTARSLSL